MIRLRVIGDGIVPVIVPNAGPALVLAATALLIAANALGTRIPEQGGRLARISFGNIVPEDVVRLDHLHSATSRTGLALCAIGGCFSPGQM